MGRRGRPNKERAPLPPIWRLSEAELVVCDQTIERTISWLSRCRGILIRWEKKAANYLGLLELACALLWFRRYNRLTHVRWFLTPPRTGRR